MKVSRRNVLRGAGVALALPWLESLAPRHVRGQAVPRRLRFVPVTFPLGTASAYWTPNGTGGGSSWEVSPILEPLESLKQHVTVLSHVDNTTYGRQPQPTGPLLSGTFTTCTKLQTNPVTNGTSIDQLVANQLVAANGGKGPTPLHSLQVGLSTRDASPDGYPAAFSRSISWRSPTEPLYKIVNPQAVFDRLVAGGFPSPPSPIPDARRAAGKSILDYVAGNAKSLQPRLGYTDRLRLENFLSSVRGVEQRLQTIPPVPGTCVPATRPSEAYAVGNVPPDYDRDRHADLMIDLMVMALQCDLTRVISFMLDDARSDFAYDFLTTRTFTATGSTPGTGRVGGLDSLAHAGQPNDAYATISWWFVSKLARLCQRLADLPDGDGATVLDNSVIWFGSETHGGATGDPRNLPLVYVGGGGGVLKRDCHLDFPASQSLANVYLTFLQKVFGARGIASFGDSDGIVPELLA